jgi:hypothetical protein
MGLKPQASPGAPSGRWTVVLALIPIRDVPNRRDLAKRRAPKKLGPSGKSPIEEQNAQSDKSDQNCSQLESPDSPLDGSVEFFLFVVQWRSAHLVDKKKIFHTGCLSGETPWCELQIGAKANKFTLFNSECSDFGNQLQRDITLHTERLCARLLREENS